jgi:hypothetical protein
MSQFMSIAMSFSCCLPLRSIAQGCDHPQPELVGDDRED